MKINFKSVFNAIFHGGVYALALSSSITMAHANSASHEDGNLMLEQNTTLLEKTEIGKPSVSSTADTSTGTQQAIPSYKDDDLKHNVQLANQVINQAVLRQDWNTLQHVLHFYGQIAGHDPILHAYVQGALYRQQAKHGQAIKLYSSILEQHPELSYVRLDLAAMLFENKAYTNSQAQFERVLQDQVVPNARAKAQAYLDAIQQLNRWDSTLAVAYHYNSNVNNATSNTYAEFYINGNKWLLLRDIHSLPKSGYQAEVSASTSRNYNIQDNHFINLSLSASKEYVTHDKEYNQYSGSLSAAYKYQDLKSWFELRPWFAYSNSDLNQLGKVNSIGVSSQYSSWLRPTWQLSMSYNNLVRRYDNPLYSPRYNGNTHLASVVIAKVLNPSLMLYTNSGVQRDRLNFKSNSSIRYTSALGLNMLLPKKIQTSVTGSFSHRLFDEMAVFDNQVRKDDEYKLGLTLWKSDFDLFSMTPKLEFSFNKTDSNIPVYNYERTEVGFKLEKRL